MRGQSFEFEELMVSARTPIRRALSIWLRMSANRGEISKVHPAPCPAAGVSPENTRCSFPNPCALRQAGAHDARGAEWLPIDLDENPPLPIRRQCGVETKLWFSK